MRVPRVRLQTLMIAVTVVGFALTIVTRPLAVTATLGIVGAAVAHFVVRAERFWSLPASGGFLAGGMVGCWLIDQSLPPTSPGREWAAFSVVLALPITLFVLSPYRARRRTLGRAAAGAPAPESPQSPMRLAWSTTWRLLVASTLATVSFRAVQPGRPPHDPANYHEMMKDLCSQEHRLFRGRAATCWDWAARGIPWSEPGEEAEILRACPIPGRSKYQTWEEQAAAWDRAAEQALRAAGVHATAR